MVYIGVPLLTSVHIQVPNKETKTDPKKHVCPAGTGTGESVGESAGVGGLCLGSSVRSGAHHGQL